jgi:hypothetical protein
MRWPARPDNHGGFRVDPYTSVGFVGVGAIVAAYFANQQGWLDAEDCVFPQRTWSVHC